MKLDAAGNFGWAYTFGSTGQDGGWGIAVDPDGTVYQAGKALLTWIIIVIFFLA